MSEGAEGKDGNAGSKQTIDVLLKAAGTIYIVSDLYRYSFIVVQTSSYYKMLREKSNHPPGPGQTESAIGLKFCMYAPLG
jgi:hypothetical protein